MRRQSWWPSTYCFVWFLRPRVFGDGFARVGRTLPQIIAACAHPVSHNLVLDNKAGDGVMGYDAATGLGEDALHDGMSQKLTGERFRQTASGGYFCECSFAADRNILCQAEANDGLLTNELIVLLRHHI